MHVTLLLVLTYAAAIPLFALGFWLIIFRADHSAPSDYPDTKPQAPWPRLVLWRRNSAAATRLVLGFTLILIAYHAAAYVSPDSWFGLKVPKDRWYILAAGIALALLGTAAAEKMEAAKESEL